MPLYDSKKVGQVDLDYWGCHRPADSRSTPGQASNMPSEEVDQLDLEPWSRRCGDRNPGQGPNMADMAADKVDQLELERLNRSYAESAQAQGPPAMPSSSSSMNGFPLNAPPASAEFSPFELSYVNAKPVKPDGGKEFMRDVPVNVLTDQFGMLGLAVAHRTQEECPSLAPLIKGISAGNAGLNLSPSDVVSDSFSGPLGHDGPLGPEELPPPVKIKEHDIAARIPPLGGENVANLSAVSREQLKPVDVKRYSEDTLFYIFYTFVGDALQMLAAGELYRRNWRYDTVKWYWFTRPANTTQKSIVKKGTSYEKGYYTIFDYSLWKKVTRPLMVLYKNLEGPPESVDPQLLDPYMCTQWLMGKAHKCCASCIKVEIDEFFASGDPKSTNRYMNDAPKCLHHAVQDRSTK